MPKNEPQSESENIMNFDLERDYKIVERLVFDATGITMISAEEIERFEGSSVVYVMIGSIDNHSYRVNLYEADTLSIWDIRDEETGEYVYMSYADSMKVLRKVIDRNDQGLRVVVTTLHDEAGITEVVDAQVREKEDPLASSDLLEIRTGDGKNYLILHRNGSISAIQDIDSGEYVLRLIR
jgi:hypothetical protein